MSGCFCDWFLFPIEGPIRQDREFAGRFQTAVEQEAFAVMRVVGGTRTVSPEPTARRKSWEP